jgi:hypothetical protein
LIFLPCILNLRLSFKPFHIISTGYYSIQTQSLKQLSRSRYSTSTPLQRLLPQHPHFATQRLSTPTHTTKLHEHLPIANMFPADCLPTHYLEARTQQDLASQKAASATTENRPTHLLPQSQRPTMTRALSSALFSLFPGSSTSPSTTPLPSPGLQQSAKMGWFAPLPKAGEADIAVSFAHSAVCDCWMCG